MASFNFREWLEAFTIPGNKQSYRWHDRDKAMKELLQSNPNAFVSFTSINKLGINPQSKYDTPIAVYSYPLDYVVQQKIDFLPFAKTAPYINVFNVDGNVIECHKLPISYKADGRATGRLMRELQRVTMVSKYAKEREPELYGGLDALWSKVKDYGKKFSKLSTSDLQKQIAKWLPEELLPVLEKAEPSEFKNLRDLVQKAETESHEIKAAMSKQQHYAELEKFAKENGLPIQFDVIMKDMNILSDASLLWLQAREWANQSPQKWTTVLRKLGIDGVVDRGTGTIHPNEPTQAAFFSTTRIKMITVIDNIMPKTGDEYTLAHLGRFPQDQRTSGYAVLQLQSWMRQLWNSLDSDRFVKPKAPAPDDIMPVLDRITELPKDTAQEIRQLSRKPEARGAIAPIIAKLKPLIDKHPLESWEKFGAEVGATA